MRILLNWPVRAIHALKDQSIVRVVAADGRVLTASAVIVTVPPPVCCVFRVPGVPFKLSPLPAAMPHTPAAASCSLARVPRLHTVDSPAQILRDSHISFTPELSPERMGALKRLDFANGLKMFLRFNKRPWPLDCRGAICSHAFAPEVWFASASTGHLDDEGVHTATFFAMSERADRIAALPLSTAVSLALSQVSEAATCWLVPEFVWAIEGRAAMTFVCKPSGAD